MTPRSLLRLYPRAWRERYGDEFLAMLDGRRLTAREALDIVGSSVGEWSRRPVVGPIVAATGAGMIAELVGRLLRGVASPPPFAILSLIVVFVAIGIGYILWRLNEWLFERSPHTGRRVTRAGLALALIAGATSVWTESRPTVAWVVVTNPAFFWTLIIWSARLRSTRRPQSVD
jgi:hypothetical protein